MTVTAGTPNDAHEVACNYVVDLCTAARHGTDDAYVNAGCRCPDARDEHRVQRKRRKLRLIENGPATLPGVGVARRLRALAALGYGIDVVADTMRMDRSYVHRLRCGRPVVERATHQRVAEVYRLLADRPRTARTAAQRTSATKTRRHAARAGWLPPLWFDDDTIDDPTYDPSTTKSPTTSSPRHDQTTFLFENVDEVVVERLVTGAPGTRATRSERQEAFHRLRAAGHSVAAAGAHLHLSWSTAGEWESSRTRIGVATSPDTAGVGVAS